LPPHPSLLALAYQPELVLLFNHGTMFFSHINQPKQYFLSAEQAYVLRPALFLLWQHWFPKNSEKRGGCGEYKSKNIEKAMDLKIVYGIKYNIIY